MTVGEIQPSFFITPQYGVDIRALSIRYTLIRGGKWSFQKYFMVVPPR